MRSLLSTFIMASFAAAFLVLTQIAVDYERGIERDSPPAVETALNHVSLPADCNEKPECRAFALIAVANGNGCRFINAEAFALSESPFSFQGACGGRNIKVSVDKKVVASGSYLSQDGCRFTPHDVEWRVNGPVKERFAKEVERIYAAVRQGELHDEKSQQEIYDKRGVSKDAGDGEKVDSQRATPCFNLKSAFGAD